MTKIGKEPSVLAVFKSGSKLVARGKKTVSFVDGEYGHEICSLRFSSEDDCMTFSSGNETIRVFPANLHRDKPQICLV